MSLRSLLSSAFFSGGVGRGRSWVPKTEHGVVARRGFEARVLELVADDPILLAITEPMLRVRQALLEEFERLDRLCQQLARRDPVCRTLMTVLGVGVVVALTYRTGVDAPERFSRSRDVGAHFGLTPKRYSSGQTDYGGRISRCGREMVRTALYQAANVLLHHGRWSSLRSWAMRIAKRGCVKGAKVALARRLAVVMHRMWTDGTSSPDALIVRRCITKGAFAELRAACVRRGGSLTGEFLDLEREIDAFAMQSEDKIVTDGFLVQWGKHAGLREQFARIEKKSIKLREKAVAAFEVKI